MSNLPKERLYNLLPAIHRQRDLLQGEPLRALLAVLEQELRAVEADTEQLYENWFIETCQELAIPDIASLLHVPGLAEGRSQVVGQRARVANTIRHRRRKGTPAGIEELVREVTGWSGRAAELANLLSVTHHMQHRRAGQCGTFNVRDMARCNALGSPFDEGPRNVDIRSVRLGKGRTNIKNLGLFLWRLQSYGITGVPATPVAGHPGCYRFDPLGRDLPLFTRAYRDTDAWRVAREAELPGPIRPLALASDLAELRARNAATPAASPPTSSAYYGIGRSFHILLENAGDPLQTAQVMPLGLYACDLEDWPLPAAGEVFIDVKRGRIAFPSALTTPPRVAYHYGFSADLGGGPYDRQATLAGRDAAFRTTVGQGGDHSSPASALTAWKQWKAQTEIEGRVAGPGVIQILDAQAYTLDALLVDGDGTLTIEAADGVRPVLLGDLRVEATGVRSLSFALSGLLVGGAIAVTGAVDLAITHCTLIPRGTPGQVPAIDATRAAPAAHVRLSSSISGPLLLPPSIQGVIIKDSIVDAHAELGGGAYAVRGGLVNGLIEAGPPVTFERSTLLGDVHIRHLSLASEVIFAGRVQIDEPNGGQARFSYLENPPFGLARFRCQPELELGGTPPAEQARIVRQLRPRFTSTRLGDPAYAQLAADCASQIREGGENCSEMGVFSHLKQRQRIESLSDALEEHLPINLHVGYFLAT